MALTRHHRLRKIVKLLRYFGDGVRTNPSNGDVVLAPGVDDAEGDASGHLVQRRAPERVEVAEELYGGADANVGLAEVEIGRASCRERVYVLV